LNETQPGFEAGLFHPDLGNEVVNGVIVVDRWKLSFRSELVNEEIPMEAVEVELEKSGRVCFTDSNRRGLKIFTLDQSIFRHPALKHFEDISDQIAADSGRRELSRRLRLVLYFAIGCVFLFWFASIALSLAVRSLAARVPPAWEDKFSQVTIEKMRKDNLLLADTNQLAQLNAVAVPLIQSLPADRRDLKFYIVDNVEPNAFALPGGYVVVHTGLLEMVESPEELLGVLAHEIAHETERHVIRHQIAAAGPLMIFGVFMHSRSGAVNLLAFGSGLMVYQGFSQAYETEADDVGWQYLVAANINPRGMISMFQKLKAYDKIIPEDAQITHAFNSHPALDKRIARLESKWKRMSQHSGFLELLPVTWPKTNPPVDFHRFHQPN
jgi:Zn-dependent protease with chaperone function